MEHSPENCKEVFALLSDYLDLELPPENCDEIKRHLANCPPCVEFVESLRKTVGLCHGYEPGVTPAHLNAEFAPNSRRPGARCWLPARGRPSERVSGQLSGFDPLQGRGVDADQPSEQAVLHLARPCGVVGTIGRVAE